MELNKRDFMDLAFRMMFSSIFMGLGMEHLFHDEIIMKIMPDWVGFRKVASICAGIVLVSGGISLITAYRIKQAAIMLAVFVVIVTITVHGPELFGHPKSLPEEWTWLWQVFQRSNFVKNVCLLGVCIHLLNYTPGKLTFANLWNVYLRKK